MSLGLEGARSRARSPGERAAARDDQSNALGYAARYLQPGDLVELEVEGIGTLRNRLGPRKALDTGYRYRAPSANAAPADA